MVKEHYKDLVGFGAFMVILFIAWIISGGPQQAKETGDAYNRFQEPLAPIQSGGTYNDLDREQKEFNFIQVQ